jgi:hypothetical protein
MNYLYKPSNVFRKAKVSSFSALPQNNSPYKSARSQAWRNLMVIAINEGLRQRCFTLDEKSEPRQAILQFIDHGLHFLVYVRDIGWGELEFDIGAGDEWPHYWKEPFMPESMPCRAFGWLERRDGKWLQTAGHHGTKIPYWVQDRLASVSVEPQGYADHGKLMI